MLRLIRQFCGDRRGTVAVVLAVSVYPVMVMIVAAAPSQPQAGAA